MNNLFLETLGTNTFVEYRIEADDELDTMSLGMLTNNNIPGLASASFTQMDRDRFIKYNVSAKVSVKQLFSGSVNKKRLLGVFSGILDAMLAAEDYMLDPSSLVLDLDYIFSDVSTCETVMICLPLLRTGVAPPDLGLFFKNILFTTQFDQTENCDHVAQLINYLNCNAVLSLPDFKTLLHDIARSSAGQAPVTARPAQPVVPAPVQQPVVPAAQPVQPVQPVQQVTPRAPVTPKPAAVKVPQAAPVVPAAPVPQAKAPQAVGEKPMSWLYLMQHYNKENAAIYKAQQEAAKANKGAVAPTPAAPAKATPAKPQPGPGFAIPGQASAGIALPGQPTPTPTAPVAPKPVVAPQPVAPKQAAVATCPKCGQPIKPGQAFCTSCGTRCGATPTPASTPTPAVAPAVAPQPASQPVYQPQPIGTPLNFGETTVLSASMGETTVLSAAVETKRHDPHLIRTKNNEKIPLNKPVFRIGKERSYVDYFVSDNTAISRGHANIVDHNGDFFIVDTNSTNHTYVNGAMIQPGVETKLAHGDKVRLANEDFEFRLY